MRVITTVIYLIIILLLSSCYLIPCGWDSDLQTVKGQTSTKSLVGTYRLDQISKQTIPNYNKLDNSEIVLQENGKLTYRNVPVSTFDFEKYYENNNQLTNGTGQWSVDNNVGNEELFVTLDNTELLNAYSTSFRLYKKDNKYVIFIIMGDPDECLAARFVKE